jgi:hypothetical protein|nr:MAG TPA: hypothetical protein [Caudoviricetes sp.]
MMKKKYFYNKDDIMKILEAPEKRAKKIIKDLNKELEEKGFLYYDKVVNAKYFNERYNIE